MCFVLHSKHIDNSSNCAEGKVQAHKSLLNLAANEESMKFGNTATFSIADRGNIIVTASILRLQPPFRSGVALLVQLHSVRRLNM